MERELIADVAKIRLAVGFLGESMNYGWWKSQFFSPHGKTYLDPLFPKTGLLSRHHGAKEAAARVHEEAVGFGNNRFHLFRLPENFETAIHRILASPEAPKAFQPVWRSKEAAEAFLSEHGGSQSGEDSGAVLMGCPTLLYRPDAWRTVAARYARAFPAGRIVFPYFQDQRENH